MDDNQTSPLKLAIILNWHVLSAASLAFVAFGSAMYAAKFTEFGEMLYILFSAGMVGAATNNYYRIARLSKNNAALKEAEGTNLAVVQLYTSLLIAGIMALVTYGLFMSGLIKGDLFPKPQKDGDYTTLVDLFNDLIPDKNGDAVKAIIWSFIAGFSERLVPNFIDNLIARNQKNDG